MGTLLSRVHRNVHQLIRRSHHELSTLYFILNVCIVCCQGIGLGNNDKAGAIISNTVTKMDLHVFRWQKKKEKLSIAN